MNNFLHRICLFLDVVYLCLLNAVEASVEGRAAGNQQTARERP